MKEFAAQAGGRYTYTDDLLNLQDLALAFGEIFSECDNFVISGCSVKGTSIEPGYVYINGRIRYFEGAANITSFPQYICEQNKVESVAYVDGGDKVGRTIYGCTISNKQPTTIDPITEKVGQYIAISKTGGNLLKDAFVGKYALLKNSTETNQDVNGNVSFLGNVTCSGNLSSKDKVSVDTNGRTALMYFDASGKFTLETRLNNNKKQAIEITDSSIVFLLNNVKVVEFNSSNTTFLKPTISSASTIGNIVVTDSNIYNGKVSDDNGEIAINKVGLNGSTTNFRDTNIGNGKGVNLVSVKGKTSTTSISGTLEVIGNTGINLIGNTVKGNKDLISSLKWYDVNKEEIASLGYTSADNMAFSITNSLASISIFGKDYVNIGKAIQENGVFLSDKYATKTDVSALSSTYAKISDTYTRAQCDGKYAVKNNGLSQFITEANTASVLRNQIGATTLSDVQSSTAQLSKHLSDMAKSEADKQKIRENIGAAKVGSFQEVLKDTGWIHLREDLYIRQIGSIVSVQGTVKSLHNGGVMFTIPNTIQPPRYAVAYTFDFVKTGAWSCKINGGERTCTVHYCSSSCGVVIPLSITYMT